MRVLYTYRRNLSALFVYRNVGIFTALAPAAAAYRLTDVTAIKVACRMSDVYLIRLQSYNLTTVYI